jgi:hypothetical protein
VEAAFDVAFDVAKVTFEVRARPGVSAAEVTFVHLALDDAKRVRPDTIGSFEPIGAHCRQNSRGQNSLRRDESLGGDHPANV